MTSDLLTLLVATEFPPNSSGGGPAVVRQMLRDWPAERLFWWSCLPERDTKFGQQTAQHRLARIPARLYPNRRLARLKSWLLEHAWSRWAASHLRRMLDEVRPDVIWVIPHGWAIPPLAAVLPAAGIGFHVTVQDYMNARRSAQRFGPARADRLAAQADRLYAGATTRDATSHPMIADLRARTGADAAQMLHAGLEASDFEYLAARLLREAEEIRIAYAGTITVEDEFALLVAALRKARSQITRPVRLELFSAHRYADRPWFDPTWMRERGNLPEPELLAALRECTWGIALMALHDDDPRYNRFSFPTKFISYLAAGLPVITLGHPEASVVKMATAYRVGPCLKTSNEAELVREMVAAWAMADPWAVFGNEIIRCARTEFDATRMRRVLYDCFRQCAAKTPAPGRRDRLP